jgi:hypothetical protein
MSSQRNRANRGRAASALRFLARNKTGGRADKVVERDIRTALGSPDRGVAVGFIDFFAAHQPPQDRFAPEHGFHWASLTLHLDYTYSIAIDDILNTELLQRPKHKASPNAAWHVTDRAVLSSTIHYVGPWVDVNCAGTISGPTANGYMIVNLEGFYDLRDGVTAYARIDNLLHRHYQDPIRFQRPGFVILPVY